MNWISVEYMYLPPRGQRVLIYNKNSGMKEIAHFHEHNLHMWLDSYGREIPAPTHWAEITPCKDFDVTN